MRRRRVCAFFFVALGSIGSSYGDGFDATRLTTTQKLYLQSCGGCHGIQGVSAPTLVPTLRGQVSAFMCTQAGREYLIRLPSIAKSQLSDAELADLMNFVVFTIGASAQLPPTTARYSASEVRALRAHPLDETSIAQHRATLVESLIRGCGVPPTLREYTAAH